MSDPKETVETDLLRAIVFIFNDRGVKDSFILGGNALVEQEMMETGSRQLEDMSYEDIPLPQTNGLFEMTGYRRVSDAGDTSWRELLWLPVGDDAIAKLMIGKPVFEETP